MKKIILLDSIRSMQNVGAIFRNADGSGFEKIILTGFTPTPPRGEIGKTALGAEDSVIWEYYENPLEIIDILKKEGYKIYSVELTEDSIDYRTFFGKQEDKICLIMGNEVSGVSQELLEISDKVLMIPMMGKKNSLNVSVAAGIVMYAFV
ncbi:TrmH family RNA methyltransferase [Candidatus Gracilibacteria bacterium]|nr:TrmH family RNA methyltransferase [Candidatus Gracilibacteria bacterium]